LVKGGRPDGGARKGQEVCSSWHFTLRQEQIVALLAAGLSDKEIAPRLGISTRTIQTHIQRLFYEYGVHRRSAVVAAWLRGQAQDGRDGGANSRSL
jgi:DNA-binding CsgD family transcriptional regulator